MPNHILSDIDRHVVLPIVNEELEADKVWQDSAGACIRSDRGVVLERFLEVWEGDEEGPWRRQLSD